MQADQHLPVKQSPTRLETNREHEIFSRETADNSPAGYRMVARLIFRNQEIRRQMPTIIVKQSGTVIDQPQLNDMVSRPGLEPGTLALKELLRQLLLRLLE